LNLGAAFDLPQALLLATPIVVHEQQEERDFLNMRERVVVLMFAYKFSMCVGGASRGTSVKALIDFILHYNCSLYITIKLIQYIAALVITRIGIYKQVTEMCAQQFAVLACKVTCSLRLLQLHQRGLGLQLCQLLKLIIRRGRLLLPVLLAHWCLGGRMRMQAVISLLRL